MNEIEKLYKNAGVEYYKEICAIKKIIDKIGNKECYFEVCCSSCPLNKTSFTTEKQLELIKFLASRKVYEQTDYLNIGIWAAFGEYVMAVGVEPFNDKLGFDLVEKDLTFEECLAKLINNLWQDLTEEEKKQVKGVLE